MSSILVGGMNTARWRFEYSFQFMGTTFVKTECKDSIFQTIIRIFANH
jgi:hypothetical protein